MRRKKSACGNVDTSGGLLNFKGAFFEEKKGACGNEDTSGRLQKFKGAVFEEKKAPAATWTPQEGF